MATQLESPVDSVEFFDALADDMNDHPDRYEILGDADLDIAFVMTRGDDAPFAVQVSFDGITCAGVTEIAPGDELAAECWIEGPLTVWQEMIENIRANGRAAGRQTINSLASFETVLVLKGSDPMGIDKFSRFNQSLQEFLDGAARL